MKQELFWTIFHTKLHLIPPIRLIKPVTVIDLLILYLHFSHMGSVALGAEKLIVLPPLVIPLADETPIIAFILSRFEVESCALILLSRQLKKTHNLVVIIEYFHFTYIKKKKEKNVSLFFKDLK